MRRVFVWWAQELTALALLSFPSCGILLWKTDTVIWDLKPISPGNNEHPRVLATSLMGMKWKIYG